MAEYKVNRIDYSLVPEEDNPFSQIQDIYNALDFMGVKHTEVQDAEADDAIASYVNNFGDKIHIIISSFDSDFFQLIDKNVKVLRYRGDNTIICDADYIKEKFDIAPPQYADFKSLTGDTSDNIKGAEKVGRKTAAQLINSFGCIENIIEKAELITKPSIKESIMRNRERLRNNYKLIKLDDKTNIPFLIDELKYEYNGITTTEVLKGIHLR